MQCRHNPTAWGKKVLPRVFFKGLGEFSENWGRSHTRLIEGGMLGRCWRLNFWGNWRLHWRIAPSNALTVGACTAFRVLHKDILYFAKNFLHLHIYVLRIRCMYSFRQSFASKILHKKISCILHRTVCICTLLYVCMYTRCFRKPYEHRSSNYSTLV